MPRTGRVDEPRPHLESTYRAVAANVAARPRHGGERGVAQRPKQERVRVFVDFRGQRKQRYTRARPDPAGTGRISFGLQRAPPAGGNRIPVTQAGAYAIKRDNKRLESDERPRSVHESSVALDH